MTSLSNSFPRASTSHTTATSPVAISSATVSLMKDSFRVRVDKAFGSLASSSSTAPSSLSSLWSLNNDEIEKVVEQSPCSAGTLIAKKEVPGVRKTYRDEEDCWDRRNELRGWCLGGELKGMVRDSKKETQAAGMSLRVAFLMI